MTKPCLGYPSRTAAALALENDGLSHARIAVLINSEGGNQITAKEVGALLASHTRNSWRRVDALSTQGAYIKAAAKIDKARVVTFLRTLIAEVEAMP